MEIRLGQKYKKDFTIAETMVKDLLKFSVFRSSQKQVSEQDYQDLWSKLVDFETSSKFTQEPLSASGDLAGLLFPQKNSILMLTFNRIKETKQFDIKLYLRRHLEVDYVEVDYLKNVKFGDHIEYSKALEFIKMYPPSSHILQLLIEKYNAEYGNNFFFG